MTRRTFLRTSCGASAWLALGPGAPGSFCLPSPTDQRKTTRDTVLVVLQLSGGNDGLNTLVPYEDDIYHRMRPTLRLPANRVLKLDSQFGFHPEMPAFHRLYQEGYLEVVNGVGYLNSSRDHDQAMRDWHTARPEDKTCQTGWAGRAADQFCQVEATDLPATFAGSIKTPFSLHSASTVIPAIDSLPVFSQTNETGQETDEELWQDLARVARAQPDEDDLLHFLRQKTLQTADSRERIQAITRASSPAGADIYPPFQLARTLRTIARLIRADLGIRLFFAELGGGGIGGFDTHAHQAANHGALLRQLSESVAAFVMNLKKQNLLDKVIVMTFSEFGRTVAENGRRGTDHGMAAPLFLAGTKIKGGLRGKHPILTDLEGGAQKFHTDFRRVYGTLLDQWIGYDSQSILGRRFDPLPILA